MSSFIHCNQCSCHPSKEQLFITNCGHLFCGRCVGKEPVANGICFVCKKSNVSPTLLEKMKADVQEYFADMSHLLKKLERINSFQKFHFQRYITLLEIELKRLKAENIRLEKKVFQMDQILKKGGVEQFKSQAQRLGNATPANALASQMSGVQVKGPPMSDSRFMESQMIQRSQNIPRGYGEFCSQPASMMQRFHSSTQAQRAAQVINRSDNASLKSSEYYTPQSAGSSMIYRGLMKPNTSRISLGPRNTSGSIYGTFRKPAESPSSFDKDASMEYTSSYYSSRPMQMMADRKKRATVSPYGR